MHFDYVLFYFIFYFFTKKNAKKHFVYNLCTKSMQITYLMYKYHIYTRNV